MWLAAWTYPGHRLEALAPRPVAHSLATGLGRRPCSLQPSKGACVSAGLPLSLPRFPVPPPSTNAFGIAIPPTPHDASLPVRSLCSFTDIVGSLVDLGCRRGAATITGDTALHAAARGGFVAVMLELLLMRDPHGLPGAAIMGPTAKPGLPSASVVASRSPHVLLSCCRLCRRGCRRGRWGIG